MRMRVLLAGLAAFAVLTLAGVVFVASKIADIPLRLPVARSCVVGADAADRVALSAEQAANAATITAVGIRKGVPDRAIVIALATAWQESKLENLTGGDRDSIGLFQQRPSQGWGTAAQIADPRYAAGRFYAELMKVDGWEEMRVTDAAQAVQRSAHPELYEQWTGKSEIMVAALTGNAPGAVGCTVNGEPTHRGTDAVKAVTDGLRLDWGDVKSSVQGTGVSLSVRSDKGGWQYAHWLVAHATERGIVRVRYGAQEWNASGGAWVQSSAPAVAARTVQAEVHG